MVHLCYLPFYYQLHLLVFELLNFHYRQQMVNKAHELVRHVQQKAGIQDPEQATQYTQQGVNILNEQSKSNPQGLQSILGGGGNRQSSGSGGGIGDMLGI
jgi:hypothetical protein